MEVGLPRLSLTGRPLRRRVTGYARYGCIGLNGGKSLLPVYCFHDRWPRLRAKRQLCTNNVNGNAGRYFWTCRHPTEDCGFFAWDDQIRPRQNHYFGGAHVLGGGPEHDDYHDDGRGLHGALHEMDDDDDAAYLFAEQSPVEAVRMHWQHVTVPKKQKKKPQRVQFDAVFQQHQHQQQQQFKTKTKANKHRSTAARSSLGSKSKIISVALYEVGANGCKCGGGALRHLGTITID